MADDSDDNKTGAGPGADPASPSWILYLTVYLIALTGLLGWGIYKKWPTCGPVCAVLPAQGTPPSVTPTPTPTPTSTPTPTPPPGTAPPAAQSSPTPVTIEAVSPKTGQINCNVQVTIKGTGFKQGAIAIFGGAPTNSLSVDSSGQLMIVQPPLHVEGDVDVVVKNPDGAISGIAKDAYSYRCPSVSETELFLLVVFAGALGGALHGLRSLYWYVGLRSLLKSWTLMYVLLPLTGASIAIIFYAVIRAGLLPVPANKDASVAVVAIAIIVGLFSQQAAVKLKDIAEALLAKPQPGPPNESKPQGSLPPGSSSAGEPSSPAPKPTIDPTHGHPGTTVTIRGTGMKTVNSITFGSVTVTPTNFSVKDDTITVTVPDPQPGVDPKVDVTVTGDAGTANSSFTYD